jgi:proton-dependent oligopeptide transporter, POT family
MAEIIKNNKMPSSIPFIIGNEAAERFNYYGLRAILVTFMVSQFYGHLPQQVGEATANAKTHDFVAWSYLLPLFGGMLADWFLGKYKTILYLSIVYAIGGITLALSTNSESLFTVALMLIALGAGGIKPCVSANVGDQFDESNNHLISKAFSYFYFAINAGSLLSILAIPYLKNTYGPQVAFGVPAIAMLIATIFFWAGRDKYRRVPPKGDSNKLVIFLTAFVSLVVSYLIFDKFSKNIFGENFQGGTGPILGAWGLMILAIAFIFKKQWFAKPGNFVGINLYALTNGGFKAAGKEYGDDKIEGIRSVWRVLSVFAFVPVFWALWDQSQSEWVVQATKTNLKWLGITWQAEQISFVNAGFILAFIPIFNFVLFPLIEKLGIRITPLRKIGAGLVLTALSFVVIALIQQKIDIYDTNLNLYIDSLHAQKDALMSNAGGKSWNDILFGLSQSWIIEHNGISISWQILAFVVLTAGEVLVSITCLEYAYTQAPPSMKSTIMAAYLLTVTFGNVLVSVIQNNIKGGGFFAQFHGAGFFWLFTGICAATAVLFMIISPRIKERNYITEG